MAVTINGSTGVQLDDNDKQQFGTGDDLQIFHDGNNNHIQGTTAGQSIYLKNDYEIQFLTSTNEKQLVSKADGAVELYYNNNLAFSTATNGCYVYGTEGNDAALYLFADEADDNADQWRIIAEQATSACWIQNRASGSYEANIKMIGNGSVELYHDNNKKAYTTSDGWRVQGDCYPTSNGTGMDLGQSSERWEDVYASNGTIQTSDKNEKNTIVDTDLGLSFVNKLKPVSYKFNGKTRTHYGLIAQDVETTLSDISKPTTGFAGFIKEDIPDKLYVEQDEIPEGKKVGDLKTAAYTTYGLRYNEFISPLIKAVQELSAEVNTLKTKVAALEAHTHE